MTINDIQASKKVTCNRCGVSELFSPDHDTPPVGWVTLILSYTEYKVQNEVYHCCLDCYVWLQKELKVKIDS